MPADRVMVRDVSWRDLCPWLIIFRTFRLAISVPVLVLATAGALLTPVGWHIGAGLFLDDAIVQRDAAFGQIVDQNRRWPGQRNAMPAPNAGRVPGSLRQILTTSANSVETVYLRFVRPVAWALDQRPSARQGAYIAFGMLWMLLVWGFFGGAVARMAAVKLGREEAIGLGEAVRHAASRYGAYCLSPLFPVFGIVLVAIPIFLLGLLMRLDWGVLVAGITWLLVLLAGLVLTILLIGLLFGWPLMWATLSSEREGDVFEAFQRSYSYTFQRPLHYLFYALLAVVFGAFCWLVVYDVAEAVVWLSQWPASWGTGIDRWREIQAAMDGPVAGWSAMTAGAWLLDLWGGLVRSVATGFGYGFFWCVATAIYLLLRRDVDQTEFDEVFVENEDPSYEFPELENTEPAVDRDADGRAAAGAAPSGEPE